MREGTALYAEAEGGAPVGRVTSGVRPDLGAPVSMGYVPRDLAAPGHAVFGEVRGKRQPVRGGQAALHPANFKR